MAATPFRRLDSSEPLYQSVAPSQDSDIHAHSYNVPPHRQHSLSPDNVHATYTPQSSIHNVAGFTTSPPPWGTSYQPLGQSPDFEKFGSQNRRPTQSSNFSRRLSSVSSGTARIFSPLMTKSWNHAHDHSAGNDTSTVKTFSKSSQCRRIFVHGIMQLIPVIVFSASIGVICFFYAEKHEYVTRSQKYIFNALVLGFTLLLGFSVQAGFKLYADLMRWRFLSMRYWDLQTFERIMGCSSQRTVLKLLWGARKKSKFVPSSVQVVCFLYFIIFIGLQVVIACLGLCYAVEDSSLKTGTRWGNVTVADLKFFSLVSPNVKPYPEGSFQDYLLQSGATNAFGYASTTFSTLTNIPPQERIWGKAIYNSSSEQGYWYQFFDCAPGKICNVLRITDRSLKSLATCEELPVTSSNQTVSFVNYREKNGTLKSLDYLGKAIVGSSAFATMNEECGPRCTTIYAYNVGPRGSSSNQSRSTAQLFKCQNIVEQITNPPPGTSSLPYSLSDRQARLIAGAIGYAGAYTPGYLYQAQSYPLNSKWSWDNEPMTEQEMAQKIMRFSTGAIAAIDQNGWRTTTQGYQPFRVQTVNMKWLWTIVLLSVIPGVQLLFLFFVMWFCYGVYIRDGSFLSNARLLRPIVEKLGDKGCALSGSEIASHFPQAKIAYGVRMSHKPYSGTVNSGNPFDAGSGYESTESGYLPGPQGHISQDIVMHLDVVSENREFSEPPMPGWRPGLPMRHGRYDGLDNEQARTKAD